MLDRLRAILRRHRNLAELNGLSDRDLADLGVSRSQAEQLAALPEAVADRVIAMGRVFGLTESELTRNRGEWEELLATCRSCTDLPACRRFLARAQDEGTADPTEAAFCPNSARFAL